MGAGRCWLRTMRRVDTLAFQQTSPRRVDCRIVNGPARHATAVLASRVVREAWSLRAPSLQAHWAASRRYQWTSQRHTLPQPRAPTHRTTWSSCARWRAPKPPPVALGVAGSRVAPVLRSPDVENLDRRGGRRASATSPRPSPVRAHGQEQPRPSVCASATICGCTAGETTTETHRRAQFSIYSGGRHPAPAPAPCGAGRCHGAARRKYCRVKLICRAPRTHQGDHHSPRASRTRRRDHHRRARA